MATANALNNSDSNAKLKSILLFPNNKKKKMT